MALNEFLRAVGFDTARLIASGLDFQLVKQTIEWKSAARFDDVLEIEIETVRLGTTSFSCRATFRRAERGRDPDHHRDGARADRGGHDEKDAAAGAVS